MARYQFLEFEREAVRILDDAKKEAASIIDNAKVLLDEEKRRSRDLGFQEGVKLGIAQSQNQLNEMRSIIQRIERGIEDQKSDFLKTIEDDTVKLVFEMAEKVVGREAHKNKEVLINNLNKALSLVIDATGVQVLVSSSDYSVLRPLIEKIQQDKPGITIEQDPSLSKGDCLVRTRRGLIDATIKTQLEKLKQAVFSEKKTDV